MQFFGPPQEIALDPEKNPTNALKSFLKKNALEMADVMENGVLKIVQKDGKSVVFAKILTPETPTLPKIPEIFLDFLRALKFGKSMNFSPSPEPFIRPVRNFLAFFGENFVEISGFGVCGEAKTWVHRDENLDFVAVKNAKNYFETLENGGVMLDPKKRREKILSDVKNLQNLHDFVAEIDENLLAENVAITEMPSAHFGEFEAKFLALPEDVILTSMKENQRYFGIYSREKKSLKNGFIFVSNSLQKDVSAIKNGYENVLRARLFDALFFYENDKKIPFDEKFLEQNLAKISFFANKKASSNLAEKVTREKKIAAFLCEKYDVDPKNRDEILTAVKFSKLDLLSEMVNEFPVLQGVMGAVYARAAGFSTSVCDAIRQQYLPNSDAGSLPDDKFCAIIALANKIDNLAFFFHANEIPSGSKDPFALRRSAAGILKILQKFDLDFDLQQDFEKICEILALDPKKQLIFDFFMERFWHILNVNPSFLQAIVSAGEKNAKNIAKKAIALQNFLQKSPEFFSIFKRVANILKNENDYQNAMKKFDKNLIKTPEEKNLFAAYENLRNTHFADFYEHLNALFSLQNIINDFFENVRIFDENPVQKNNKIALVSLLYHEFLKIADVKKISF